MSGEPEESPSGPDGNGPAVWAALGAASREKADHFLDEQTEFVHLQKEHLHEQRQLLLSHLKWRRFEDQMKGALQIMLVTLGAAVVVAVGAAVWNASRAEGLVIDAFSVPPDFSQRGITGDTVAGDITEQIASIREFTNENSYSRSKGVSKDGKDEVRVEIPETGISVSEAWRYLRAWLGDERHLTGSVREIGNGQIAFALSVPGANGVTLEGPARDLGKLEAEAAEAVFAGVDPQNYVNYLSARRRHMDAMNAAERFTLLAQGDRERSDSYALWTYTTADATGDFVLAIARAKVGIGIDPNLAATRVQLMNEYKYLGRSEEELQQARIVLSLQESDQLASHRSGGFVAMRTRSEARINRLLGVFGNDAAWDCVHACTYAEQLLFQATSAARRHDPSGSEALITASLAAGTDDLADLAEARAYAEMSRGDWREALAEAMNARAAYGQEKDNLSAKFIATTQDSRFAPLIAMAQAHLGEFTQAHGTIDAASRDCYDCVQARAVVDEVEGKTAAAAFWFADAVRQGPSIPFAYADWGRMLLRAGKCDAAIAKFATAHDRGPHFADPLEMWGEALMQKNRSDLALAKFEEAAKYAPNWGRLHLKWGEALFYAGKSDEAQKQFAMAANLDLTSSEKSALAKDQAIVARHG